MILLRRNQSKEAFVEPAEEPTYLEKARMSGQKNLEKSDLSKSIDRTDFTKSIDYKKDVDFDEIEKIWAVQDKWRLITWGMRQK